MIRQEFIVDAQVFHKPIKKNAEAAPQDGEVTISMQETDVTIIDNKENQIKISMEDFCQVAEKILIQQEQQNED